LAGGLVDKVKSVIPHGKAGSASARNPVEASVKAEAGQGKGKLRMLLASRILVPIVMLVLQIPPWGAIIFWGEEVNVSNTDLPRIADVLWNDIGISLGGGPAAVMALVVACIVLWILCLVCGACYCAAADDDSPLFWIAALIGGWASGSVIFEIIIEKLLPHIRKLVFIASGVSVLAAVVFMGVMSDIADNLYEMGDAYGVATPVLYIIFAAIPVCVEIYTRNVAGAVDIEIMESSAGTATPRPAKSDSTFDVVLESCGSDKAAVVKAVRNITGIEEMKAKEMAESAPVTILNGVSKARAGYAAERLKEIGAFVTIK
jgi:ribosomal protein L7/L12